MQFSPNGLTLDGARSQRYAQCSKRSLHADSKKRDSSRRRQQELKQAEQMEHSTTQTTEILSFDNRASAEKGKCGRAAKALLPGIFCNWKKGRGQERAA